MISLADGWKIGKLRPTNVEGKVRVTIHPTDNVLSLPSGSSHSTRYQWELRTGKLWVPFLVAFYIKCNFEVNNSLGISYPATRKWCLRRFLWLFVLSFFNMAVKLPIRRSKMCFLEAQNTIQYVFHPSARWTLEREIRSHRCKYASHDMESTETNRCRS